jgi:hypothetical protein
MEKYGKSIIFVSFYDRGTGHRRYFSIHDSKRPISTGNLYEGLDPQEIYNYGTPRLSKEEESIALNYIKQALVPIAVELGNNWIKGKRANFTPTTIQEVLKGLRKTAQSRPLETGWGSTVYEFTKWTNNVAHIPLKFMICKGRTADDLKWKLMAGLEDPIISRDYYYLVKFDNDGKPVVDYTVA